MGRDLRDFSQLDGNLEGLWECISFMVMDDSERSFEGQFARSTFLAR